VKVRDLRELLAGFPDDDDVVLESRTTGAFGAAKIVRGDIVAARQSYRRPPEQESGRGPTAPLNPRVVVLESA
jgi:hypothetical protein